MFRSVDEADTFGRVEIFGEGRSCGALQAANVFPGTLDGGAKLQIADIARIRLGLQEKLHASRGITTQEYRRQIA